MEQWWNDNQQEKTDESQENFVSVILGSPRISHYITEV
jgi:hypothetical protein